MTFAPSPKSQPEDAQRGWSQSMIGPVILIFLVAVPMWMPGCTARQHVATGMIGEQILMTTVDSKQAAQYLGFPATLPAAAKNQIETVVSRYDAKPLDRSTLRELARETSVDFAAIYFCRRILAQDDNQRLQQAFLQGRYNNSAQSSHAPLTSMQAKRPIASCSFPDFTTEAIPLRRLI